MEFKETNLQLHSFKQRDNCDSDNENAVLREIQ